jgi:hypothetical protein
MGPRAKKAEASSPGKGELKDERERRLKRSQEAQRCVCRRLRALFGC